MGELSAVQTDKPFSFILDNSQLSMPDLACNKVFRINPIALKTARTLWSSGRSEGNRVNDRGILGLGVVLAKYLSCSFTM